jgi:hypothetical protein
MIDSYGARERRTFVKWENPNEGYKEPSNCIEGPFSLIVTAKSRFIGLVIVTKLPFATRQ